MLTKVFSRRFVTTCATAMFVLWCTGQLARDRTWLTGLMFYIPAVPACLGMFFVAVWNLLAKQRVIGWGFFAGALLAGYVACQVDNQMFRPSPTVADAGQHTLVHWNALDGDLNWPGAQQHLVQQHADIYVLSEPPDAAALERLRTSLGSDYSAQRLGNMAMVARGSMSEFESLVQSKRIEVHTFEWAVDGQVLRMFGVDLVSSIFVARDPLLRQVNALIATYKPDIIVGDFNAPRRSLGLCDLPAGYRHAYNECGAGPGYTWPVPIPVYALDQCILGVRIAPTSYNLSTTWSDHRVQTLKFSCTSPR